MEGFGNTLPYFLKFIESQQTFYINTLQLYSSSSYTLTVQGTIPVLASSTFSFDLSITGCESAQVFAPFVTTKVYNIGNSRAEIALDQVTVNDTLCSFTTKETLKFGKHPKTNVKYQTTKVPSGMLH